MDPIGNDPVYRSDGVSWIISTLVETKNIECKCQKLKIRDIEIENDGVGENIEFTGKIRIYEFATYEKTFFSIYEVSLKRKNHLLPWYRWKKGGFHTLHELVNLFSVL